jgi:DNA polymerase-3 subunit epsilon
LLKGNKLIELKQIEHFLIKDTNFLVVDVETTGLSADNDRITEIAFVNVLDGKITDEFCTLINPRQFVPRYITELTGITNEMVSDKNNFEETMPRINDFLNGIEGYKVFCGHNVSFDYRFINASLERAGANRLNMQTLCTARLARRLKLGLQSKSLYSLSKHFKINVTRRHRALDDARATAVILINFLDVLINKYDYESLEELLSFQHKKIYELKKLPANIKQIKEQLRNASYNSGVYFMKNKEDEIIYIGKAKNLRYRLRSYFYHNVTHTGKIRRMIREVRKVEYELTDSELSALILESRLIKKYKPKYNSATKRYGRFPFIKIDVQNAYPKVEKTYEVRLDGARYYGPFKSSFTVNSLLEKINKSFKIRKCDDKKLLPDKYRSSCMYYEIKLCNAPCNFTESHKSYRTGVNRVMEFLEAETSKGAINELENQMNDLAEDLKYEEASMVRDKINDLKRVILNMELTASEVNLKNFIIKCREGASDNSSELFFIAGGKLIKNIKLNKDKDVDYQYEINIISELVQNIYFRGNLFGSVYLNNPGKFTKEELDSMKIISNWVCLNNSPETLLKVNSKITTGKILEFVYS